MTTYMEKPLAELSDAELKLALRHHVYLVMDLNNYEGNAISRPAQSSADTRGRQLEAEFARRGLDVGEIVRAIMQEEGLSSE